MRSGGPYAMTFFEAVSDAFAKYVTFRGRSSRAAYWWFYLFTLLGRSAAAVVDHHPRHGLHRRDRGAGAPPAEPRRPGPPTPRRRPLGVVAADRLPPHHRRHPAPGLHAPAQRAAERLGSRPGHGRAASRVGGSSWPAKVRRRRRTTLRDAARHEI